MSTPVKTQADFQRICLQRVEEADILLAAGKWDGVYYLAGYAVECALKSCIIKRLMTSDAFPEKKFSEQCYQHNLILLLRLASLEDELKRSSSLATRWDIITQWTEQSRYEFGRAEAEVRLFLSAITDPAEGVLPWIRAHW